jgi:dTDP-4-amino-4,6-dideoxygalactose transaminase
MRQETGSLRLRARQLYRCSGRVDILPDDGEDLPSGSRGGWVVQFDATTRAACKWGTMGPSGCLDVILNIVARDRERGSSLDGLGSGTGELLSVMEDPGLGPITYLGIACRAGTSGRSGHQFARAALLEIDVAAPGATLDLIGCDYLIVPDPFVTKSGRSHAETWSVLQSTVESMWPMVRRGVALDMTSEPIDGKCDASLRPMMDDAARFLKRIGGQGIFIKTDDALSGFTAYAFKHDRTPSNGPNQTVGASQRLPVLRPRLPMVEKLAPYLRRIDANRSYSNHGPLLAELQARLANHWGTPAGSVVCAASGTMALVGAILAIAGRANDQRPFALTSAFTFAATAVALELCGYRTYLADIDTESWMLDPERLARRPDLARIGVVVPVAPFGRPVSQARWKVFQNETGIPVVVDGAASFDRVTDRPETFLGAVPVVLSFHATKAFGVGEGGCVVSSDSEQMPRVVRALNYGFLASRDSGGPSANGKMSEYHAAVGLAELDQWLQKRAALHAVADQYRRKMRDAGLGDRLTAAPEISSTYLLFHCADAAEAQRIQAGLSRRGIDTRLWYGEGLHRHSYFSRLRREDLAVTDNLAPRLLGLPVAEDLMEGDVTRVVSAVADELAEAR